MAVVRALMAERMPSAYFGVDASKVSSCEGQSRESCGLMYGGHTQQMHVRVKTESAHLLAQSLHALRLNFSIKILVRSNVLNLGNADGDESA